MRACLIALVLLLVAGPALAGPGDQGQRQVAFARSELADGEFERALRSAESALRLSPGLHEAILVKALAYEGLGEFELAQSLLRGYLEEVPSVEQEPEAVETLDRMSERLNRRKTRAPRPAPASARVIPDAPVDIEPYRQRITSAIEQGRPHTAWSAALELTRAAPDAPESWLLTAGAANSTGRTLAAVRAYRRYQRLGGDDPRVAQVLDLLAAEFGTVQVNLMGRLAGFSPRVTLTVGSEVLRSRSDGPSHTFPDLPPGEEVSILVVGRGLLSTAATATAPGPGESTVVDLAVTSIGFGAVRFGAWTAEELTVQIHNEGEWAEVAASSEHEVTAGATTLRVVGKYGHVDAQLEVPEGASVPVEPRLFSPAQLTLTGLPAGAEVRVFVEGPDGLTIEQLRAISRRNATPDPATGIPVAGTQKFRSLAGGRVGVFVKHPTWGEGALEVVIMAGEAHSAEFEVATLPTQPEPPTAAADVASAGAETAKRTAKAPPPAPGAVLGFGLGGGLAGAAVALGLVGGQAAADAREVEATLYWGGQSTVALDRLIDDGRGHALRRDITIGAAIGAGVGSALSFVLGGTAAREHGQVSVSAAWVPLDGGTAYLALGGRW